MTIQWSWWVTARVRHLYGSKRSLVVLLFVASVVIVLLASMYARILIDQSRKSII